MITLSLLFASAQMQNVYTPLPFTAHLVFCIAATAVYCAQYYRKHSSHYLLLALAVDGTFLTQINTDSIFITLLGVVELALLIAAAVFSFQFSREQKRKAAAEGKDNDEHKPPEEKKENAVDAAFDD